MDLGLEQAGMSCAWQVEIDEFCQRVLTKHWPDVPKFRDVRECGKHNLEQVDLIAGGFPCQDISNAGNRAGIEGERSGLWSEFYRIICEIRPRYVFVENVSALLFRGMDRVLRDLAVSGYDAEWRVLRASDAGAPHRRERVFIVAYANHAGRKGKELLLQGGFGISGSVRAGTRSSEWAAFRNSPTLEAALRGHIRTPVLCRVDDGIPYRLERGIALGNAVVPQIAEWIGRQIIKTNDPHTG